MTACAALVFQNITQAVWRSIVEAMGEDVSTVEDTGTAEQSGVKIEWKRDAAAEALTIQCLSKPFIVPCAMVDQHIKGMVQAALMKNGLDVG